MTRIEAIYEKGVLRPVGRLPYREGSRLTLSVEDEANVQPAEEPYARSFGIMPAEDAAEIGRIVAEEFGKIDPDAWR